MSERSLAEEIIYQARNNPEVYAEMAAGENTYWSKRLSNPEFRDKRKRAQKAAKLLGKNKSRIKIKGYFAGRDEVLRDGLVLGCGEGRAERKFYAQGICQKFHGIDIAEEAVALAREIAAEENLPMTYSVADLNKVQLEENAYDFVSAQNFLHHVVFLEELLDQIWTSLRPNGFLVVDDFVGETQFQWEEKRMKVCGDLLDILPVKHKTNSMNGRPLKLKRPIPGELCSPFEAIRSGEIVSMLKKRFHVEEERVAGSFKYHVLPIGVMESYAENDESQTIYNLLKYFDQLLVSEGVLPPTSVQMILRPKGK